MYKISKRELQRRAESRGKYPEGWRWYVVMTHSGREQAVACRVRGRLDAKTLSETLLPAYEDDGGETVYLFRSYMFTRCRMDDRVYMEICEDPEVIQVLGEGWRLPSPVKDEEMKHLRGVLDVCRQPRMIRPTKIGDLVEVASGPLQGLRGHVIEERENSVRVQAGFSFLGPETAVSLVIARSALKADLGRVAAGVGMSQ